MDRNLYFEKGGALCIYEENWNGGLYKRLFGWYQGQSHHA